MEDLDVDIGGADNYEVVDDTNFSRCTKCQREITKEEDYGTWYCFACIHKENDPVMSHFVRVPYMIDHGGMIWGGMPDNAEPDCHLRELPIWKEHPDDSHFKKFPCSKLSEQMDLVMQRSEWEKEKQPEPRLYTCFVCGKQHDAVKDLEGVPVNPNWHAGPDVSGLSL